MAGKRHANLQLCYCPHCRGEPAYPDSTPRWPSSHVTLPPALDEQCGAGWFQTSCTATGGLRQRWGWWGCTWARKHDGQQSALAPGRGLGLPPGNNHGAKQSHVHDSKGDELSVCRHILIYVNRKGLEMLIEMMNLCNVCFIFTVRGRVCLVRDRECVDHVSRQLAKEPQNHSPLPHQYVRSQQWPKPLALCKTTQYLLIAPYLSFQCAVSTTSSSYVCDMSVHRWNES